MIVKLGLLLLLGIGSPSALRAETENLNTTFSESEKNQGHRYDVALLLQKIGQIQQAVQQIHGELESHTKVIEAMAAKLQHALIQLEASQSTQPSTSLQTLASSDEASYREAFQLIQKKQWPQATEKLLVFIRQYPESKALPNALYWLGELHLAQDKPKEALVYLSRMITEFPHAIKAPSALLKQGQIFLSLDESLEAKRSFERILTHYPQTAAATLAKQKLEMMAKSSAEHAI